MKTSYFAKYKEKDGVNIAMRPVPGFKGSSYPDLFPHADFLWQYKADGNKEAYIKAYNERVLSHLNPQKVYDDLKDSVLLCWEKSGSFCHRRLVADWLQKELNVIVEEL